MARDSEVKSRQLEEWRGEFGNAYIGRNQLTDDAWRARFTQWSTMLAPLADRPPASVLEVGANIGNNIVILKQLLNAEFYAVEPNASARARMVAEKIVPEANAIDAAAQKLPLADNAVDMAFTSGVLIHIHPDDLLTACTELYRVSRRYVLCAEYFSPEPEERRYRGHEGLLFKRDFGGFFMDSFPDLKLLGHGFLWKRVTGLDNLHWWAFQKPAA